MVRIANPTEMKRSRLRREIIQKLDLKIIQKYFLCGAPNGAPVPL